MTAIAPEVTLAGETLPYLGVAFSFDHLPPLFLGSAIGVELRTGRK